MAYGTAGPTIGPGCDGCRAARNVATGLGFSLPSWLKPIISEASSFLPGGPLISAGVNAIPSGGGGSGPCPQAPLTAVAAALATMTPAELSSLQTSLNNSHVPGASVNNPASVAYWAAGGSDCNTSASAHPDVAAFNARVAAVQQAAIASSGAPYPVQYGPTVSPIIFEATDGGSYGGPNPVSPFYGPVVQQQQPSTLDKILAFLGKAGSQALTAAESAAAASAYAQMSPAQQAQLRAQAASQSTNPLVKYEVPIAIGAGALLLVLVLSGRRGRR